MILTDHRTITLELVLAEELQVKHSSTRKYNVRKAKWALFSDILCIAMAELGLTEEEISKCEVPKVLEDFVLKYNRTISSDERCKN